MLSNVRPTLDSPLRNLVTKLCCCADREYLKAEQEEFVFPPLEVLQSISRSDTNSYGTLAPSSPVRQIATQCIAAVLMGTWGVLGLKGSFVPIRTTEHLAKQ